MNLSADFDAKISNSEMNDPDTSFRLVQNRNEILVLKALSSRGVMYGTNRNK